MSTFFKIEILLLLTLNNINIHYCSSKYYRNHNFLKSCILKIYFIKIYLKYEVQYIIEIINKMIF